MVFDEQGKMFGAFFNPSETFDKEKEYYSFGRAFINSSIFAVLMIFLSGVLLLLVKNNLPTFLNGLSLSVSENFFLFQLTTKYLFLGCLLLMIAFFILNLYLSFFGEIGGKLFGESGEFTMQYYSNSLWVGVLSILIFFGTLLFLFFTPLAVWLGYWVYYLPLIVLGLMLLYSFWILAESFKANQKMNLFQGFLTILLALVIPGALIVFLG